MTKVVFVASLAHSGSTLLDMIIGAHQSAVSMGEIWNALRRANDPQRQCTCGKTADDCPVWGPLLEWSRKNTSASMDKKYASVIDAVRNEYGNDVFIVDSSKQTKPLELVVSNPDIEAKILFLVKDIRSYIISHREKSTINRTNKTRNLKTLYDRYFLYNIYRWYRGNAEIEKFLRSRSLGYFQIGYEELCFRPEEMLKKLCMFIEIEFHPNMLSAKNSRSHIIRGNEMRYSEKKVSEIVYDHRWLKSQKSGLYAFFCWPLLSWNSRKVYSNL